jgi:hypothetical protein
VLLRVGGVRNSVRPEYAALGAAASRGTPLVLLGIIGGVTGDKSGPTVLYLHAAVFG